MAGRHARRQVGEERRDLGVDVAARIDVAHPREVLVARLLDDRQPHLQMRFEPLDRGRHDVGHDPRALAAAERDEAERSVGIGRRIGRRGRGEHERPHRIAGARRLGGELRLAVEHAGKLVAMAVTRGASRRLARPITAFCSWMIVGMPRSVAASTGGTVG